MATPYNQARVSPQQRSDAVANVSTADADATYGQPEADLINELKTKLNATLAALRKAGVLPE